MASLFECLNRSDRAGINSHMKNALKNEDDLRVFIGEILAYCVAIDYKGIPSKHPIIIINSLKNIISDDRQRPSLPILESMVKFVAGKPIRISDPNILNIVTQEEQASSVFFLDLENAIQRGNIEKSHVEAAKIYLIAENSFSILECIAELGLQNIDKLGLFIYHFLRSAAFQPSVENHWTFICSGLQTILSGALPEPHKFKNNKPGHFIDKSLTHDNPLTLINFSAMNRLYDQEYLRIRAFKREINAWLDTLELPSDIKFNATNKNSWVRDYYNNPADQIIKTAEKMIKIENARANETLFKKLVALDSIRYLITLMSKKDLEKIDYYVERINIS